MIELALIWLVFINIAGIGFGIYGYFAAKRKWVK